MEILKGPSKLEAMLYQAKLVQTVPLAEIYDIKARTSVQRVWQNPLICNQKPDVHDPQQWYDKLHACTRGEFFAEALHHCKKVLDLGCGEGWPSLYLARTIPHVTGIDLSPEHIYLARNTAHLMGLLNIEFHAVEIEKMLFENDTFDGVCFGGNVFTYNRDPQIMLQHIKRVLKPGGTFAFEQWPIDPNTPTHERIQWFIDNNGPIVHYGAGSGLYWRNYFILIKPDTNQGKKLLEVGDRLIPTHDAALTDEQVSICNGIISAILAGDVSSIDRVITEGECRSIAANEFPELLQEAGFEEVTSWGLPDAGAFAQSLQAAGLLSQLQQDDLIPYLRALVKSAPKTPGWTHSWVTCKKETHHL
jgi:SAM-dependent methyltransferase